MVITRTTPGTAGVVPVVADHVCHATGCEVEVPPRMFVCRKHWRRLPRTYQMAIWDTYKPGQEITKDPSDEYLHAAMAAVRYLERADADTSTAGPREARGGAR